ncbi:hypothetical protein DAPPUDRAFT_269765 [Daphnia pulex]|uniref:Uncharacterized protein n=1 Tax=Daphnia pulex TaxID=6669 RepID=E9HZR8_DAPPU|nr:hypothetical protein DAPPUDRAFT_269765 [Daphnia pulex]|eukprot:EFX62764.1 hypothetical protein DAPPUDRAFT_269765 [Daphnia pulex]
METTLPTTIFIDSEDSFHFSLRPVQSHVLVIHQIGQENLSPYGFGLTLKMNIEASRFGNHTVHQIPEAE